MRPCQICDNTGKRVVMGNYERFALFECTECGHRYVDGLIDQAYFDDYYLTQYTTDDKPYSDARLNSLADLVAGYKLERVLDIGGTDGELIQRLRTRGLYAVPSGVGDQQFITEKSDAVILSHTLEHIYDVGAMFVRINHEIKSNGYLFVEIPIHLTYQEPTKVDFHWQHVNKFRPEDIEALFVKHGYKIELSQQIEDYREYQVWRIVGRKNGTK